jgi:hypothetical protein
MFRVLMPAAVLLLAGCGSDQPLPMATTAEKARPAIEAALNAWKDGKTPDDLQKQSPAVYLLDADFKRGAKLANFTIDGDGRPYGTGYRFDVTLQLDGGKAGGKKLAYRVVTDPTVSISREDD